MDKSRLTWKRLASLLLLTSLALESHAQVYCSSSQGNDRNDGKTPQSAVRTIRHAYELGTDIRLRGGDTFYEQIDFKASAENPCTIRPYGGGMPRISGFRVVPKGKGLWTRGRFNGQNEWVKDRKGDVFRLDLWDRKLKGFTLNDKKSCDIGCIYSPSTDEIHGIRCGFRSPSDTIPERLKGRQFAVCLSDDYDFYQPWRTVMKAETEVLAMPDDRYLYVKYSSGDLNRQELWLSSGRTGVSTRHTTLEGLRIEGWGVHGVGTGTNTNVRRCSIDIIGGSLFIGYSAGTRYGNGIEFYISSTARDCLCEENEISRTFDAGITIQGAGHPGAYAENIVFRKNIIRDCRQSMEFWLVNSDMENPGHLLPFRNCLAEDNICYPTRSLYGRGNDANNSQLLFYQTNSDIAGLTIRGNTFIGGDTFLFETGKRVAAYSDNTFICTPGQYLDRKTLRLSDNYEEDIEMIRRKTGERSLHVIVKKSLKAPFSREDIIYESSPLPSCYDKLFESRIPEVKDIQPRQLDAFLFWTDSHTNANALSTPYVMKEVLRQVSSSSDKVIWGGDAMPAFANGIDEYWYAQERMNEVVETFARNYNVRGNHDLTVKSSAESSNGRTFPQTLTAQLLFESTDYAVLRNPDDPAGCYYYFDEPEARLRYIVLETTDSTGDPGQPWGVRGTVGETQVNWVFNHVIPQTPSGYSLIFITHIPLIADMSKGHDLVHLREAIEGIPGKRPDLRVLMVLSGHMHYDYTSYENGILHVVSCSNAYYRDFRCSPLHADDAKMVPGSGNEQSFDYVSIDRDSNHIRMVRFGPCSSRVFSTQPHRMKVGQTISLRSEKEVREWIIHDSRGNVCEPLPGYQSLWIWKQNTATIDSLGTVHAIAPGEAVAIALTKDGREEYHYIAVEN